MREPITSQSVRMDSSISVSEGQLRHAYVQLIEGHLKMEAERRSDGGGGGREVEVMDEFACAGMLSGSLTSLHDGVERIFGVKFDIGEQEAFHTSDGQIWLKLQGQENGVRAAKLFVKGVVNQEEQQEVSYPGVLHCVFCGARGLFIDSLIRNTSAQIVLGSRGHLLISGLAEPVVRACSLIADLVEKYECTQSRSTDPGERGSSESLDSRRAFKALVEKWEDRHILDLLVLPGSVKEVLLDLVKESGLEPTSRMALTDGNERGGADGYSVGKWDSTTCRWDEAMAEGSSQGPAIQHFLPAGLQGRKDSTKRLFTQVLGDQDQSEHGVTLNTPVTEEPGQEDERELQFLLLLKFFTAMGYTEDVVKQVLARTGPKEASQILDLVQQEQDRTDQGQTAQANQDVVTLQREKNRPCESEHRDDGESTAGARLKLMNGETRNGEGVKENTIHPQTEASNAKGQEEEEQEEDFVLRVLKKAAVSCGYAEQKVAEVYNMLPNRSTHHLLLELQRETPDTFWEEPREIDDVVLEKGGPNFSPAVGGTREVETLVPSGEREPVDQTWQAMPKKHTGQEDVLDWNNTPDQFTVNQYTSKKKQQHLPKLKIPHQNSLQEVKGPPMLTYSTSLNPTHATSKQNQHKQPSTMNKTPQAPKALKLALQDPQSSVQPGKDSFTPRAKERQGFTSTSSVVVTGEQRFLEGLQTPFELQLTDNPGDPGLRTIIIDGSNVAMSHGLGLFFSCRGIALAVQHFWDRGHRHITALLPQWRQKVDPKTKEQHYLIELQRLGLLAYTPSREVQGKRISSYDDRFMLQLAEKTNGVIVTNDNLRDLLDDSPVWRDIIKKRLLQYTLVGDHFMVPDDPLGRGGPHLDDFLRLNHSNPHPGSHSFAGMATAFRSPRPPRSQTEVLNFRDRRNGNAEMGSGNTWNRPRQFGAPAGDRSLEETAGLREQLCQVFSGQDNMVALVLQCHPAERDVNVLSGLILEQQKD